MNPVGNAEFNLIRSLIYKRAGIRMKDSKKALVANRLRKRLVARGFTTYKQYYDFLTKNPGGQSELVEFVNCLTTNETFFFRHGEQIEYLVDTILPSMMEKDKKIRIWSAACSSGEEAYSIAIKIMEKFGRSMTDRFEIIGTDINRSMIDRAKEGIYKSYAVQRMPEAYRKKYFNMQTKELYHLSEFIKRTVSFSSQNLLDPFRRHYFDVVFCRNVMIYFDQQSKTRVLANLFTSLKEGGFLITGYSENLMNSQSFFQYIKPTIYQKSRDQG